MRTMNKIVALSLVLAMALSMMASAASFKDQATINADLMDEINLLVALGVYSENGTGAGYFEPNGTITRAQAAKIIYVLKNKGVDNGATSWTGLNIFTDVEAGAWYEGYVNYCASTGILAGVGEGKYNPNGTLTGVELAKMLLVVIGYKADVEGYTGDKWAENIIADAEAAGIFVDYELPVRGVITREWAAKMIVNAIYATKVKYEDGELTEMYNQNNDPITYAEQNLGLNTFVGQLVANANVALEEGEGADGINADKTCLVVNDDDEFEFKYDVDNALVGQNVKVLFNGSKIYGVSAAEGVVVLETTMDAVDTDDLDEDIVVFDNYVVNADLADYFGENDAREVVLIDNDGDEDYEIALTKSVVYDFVSYINPSKYMLKLEGNSEFALNKTTYNKINFVDTVKKGDAVKITEDISAGKLVYNIEKLDVVTGTITKVTSAGVATIDGKALEAHVDAADLAVNKTVLNYYVDKYVVLSDEVVEKDELPTNLALVIDSGVVTVTEKDKFGNTVENSEKEVLKVEIVSNDGKRAIYEYNPEISGVLAEDDVVEGTIYEYVIKNEKLGLKELEGFTAEPSAEAKFVDKTNKVDGIRTNEDSIFFVVTEDEENEDMIVTVLSASEIKKDMPVISLNMAVVEDGFNYVVAAALNGGVEATADEVIGLVANGYESELVDGETVVYIDVTNLDGTVVTLKLEAAEGEDADDVIAKAEEIKGKFVEYTDATDVEVVDLEDIFTAGVLEYAEGNGLVIDGVEYELAEKVKVYYVDTYKDGDNTKIAITEGEGFTVSEELGEDLMAESVMFIYDSEDEVITEIIVEVDGEEIVLP